jgi:phosphatidylserine decarboxylase
MFHEPPLIRDRKTNEVHEEIVEGETFMKAIWKPFGYFTVGWALTYHFPAKLYGWWNNRSWSRKKIASFIEKHKIDKNEFLLPEKDFKCFNDFFSRKLKRDARPIAQEKDRLVSPGDGKLLVFPKLQENQIFILKNSPINLEILISQKDWLDQFRDGSAMILRLAPPDYHRFHLPDGGTLTKSIRKPGRLYSVHPYALNQKHPVYHLNEHHETLLESDHYGSILMIEVGATFVGQITQTFESGTYLKKGEEKGYFEFGGSSVILLFQKKKIKFDEDLIESSKFFYETQVKMGEGIAVPDPTD